ncbi:MAG: hypothetical protein H0T78_08335 [Longispora sp.]|nr:hypothetical protein [Longispora sp. (in: high G+C Gram-positive bacteria)]
MTRVPASRTSDGSPTPIYNVGNKAFNSGSLRIEAPIHITIGGSARVILTEDAYGAEVIASENSRVLVRTKATVTASDHVQVVAEQWQRITGIGSGIQIFLSKTTRATSTSMILPGSGDSTRRHSA